MTSPRETERPFCLPDPFNLGNVVRGTIFHDVERYGDLQITHVNDEPASQYIHATPKFFYPGHHQSPRHEFSANDFSECPFTVFEKLDGTNIFMFRYVDTRGKSFTSFKTRLVPFLRSDGFKDWVHLFQQATAKQPELLDKYLALPGGHAFELFGYLNEILVRYDVALDVRYLYSVDHAGAIRCHERTGIVASGTGKDAALATYNEHLEKAEHLFQDGKRAEGFMFYFEDGTVYKCKPVCVVQEQGDSPFIGKEDIHVTAMNASEMIGDIDELLDTTVLLLGEVYEEHLVQRTMPRITQVVENAKSYLLVQCEALTVMQDLGFTWSKERKGDIMRAVMQRFPRNMSSRIFGMLSGKASRPS